MRLLDYLREAKKEFFKHQLDFVTDALLMPRIRMLLADDVGLGKTVQAALLIKALLEEGRASAVLVIVPRAVLDQWSVELSAFGVRHYVIEAPDFPLGHSVYLITMDRAKMEPYWKRLLQVKWSLVVVDEAHKVKPERKRWYIRYFCPNDVNCPLLTATPHTGDPEHYKALTDLVGGTVVRREKRDVEEYEGRRIFPRLKYWIARVKAGDEVEVAGEILRIVKSLGNVEPIALVVAEKRALSSPVAFLKTLSKISGGGECDLDEGELDACLGSLASHEGLRKLAEKYAYARDRKLEAFKALLGMLKGRKVLVFTEYATTAEYLFQSLASGCRVVESGEGFGRADCGELGVMYADARARRQIDVSVEAANLAAAHSTAVFISTDMMSEGVNLQMFDVVVNYEVVWSPTKHVQRVGRIWRLGQRAGEVLVVDMAMYAPGGGTEYDYYMALMEKLYEISKVALAPVANSEAVEVYEVDEESVKRVLKLSSAAYVSEEEAYKGAVGGRLEELRRKIEAILREAAALRWKGRSLVEEGLKVKLGVDGGPPEPGGGYYSVRVEYWAGGVRLYGERLLVRLPTPLSRSRTVQEAVYREAQVDWDSVEEEPGEVKEDEKSTISYLVTRHVLQPLRRYVSEASSYAPLPADVSIRITSIRRARVEGYAAVGTDFEALVQRELNASRLRAMTELAAAKCAERKLRELGFRVVHSYESVPRPFDMVVERGGLKYTVEVKGKWVGRRDDPLSFTANEVDWASRFADRHIICVAYVDRDACVEVECVPFAEFQKRWILQTERGIEYRYLAYKREEGEIS